MAGIGFELKKLLRKDELHSKLSAFLYTGLVTNGPWLFSVVAMTCLMILGRRFTNEHDLNHFMGINIYCFCFSMMFTGGSQLVITRYVSDCIFSNQESRVLSIYMASLLLALVLSLVVAVPVIYILHLPIFTSILSLTLFTLVCTMWMTMIFVSAIQAYMRVVYAFFVGFTFVVPAALLGGYLIGLDGFLLGMDAGIAIIVFLLSSCLFSEFEGSMKPDREVLKQHLKYWSLFLTGMFSMLGMWVDKIMLWYFAGSEVIAPLRIYAVYDGAMFYSYLTVIPAMSYFVMLIETDMYEKFRRYFFLLEEKVNLDVLERMRVDLVDNLKMHGMRVFLFQVFITSVILFFSPWLVVFLKLDWSQWNPFRIGCVGALFQMAVALLSIVLAYLDCRREMLIVNACFFVINCVATYFTTADYWLYGYGYVTAGIITSVICLILVRHRLAELHYYTFAYPPIST